MTRSLVFLTLSISLLASPSLAQLEVVTNNGANPNPLDASCVQEGEYAMRVSQVPPATSAMFVEAGDTAGFDDETIFRAQFWFNPRTMMVDHGRKHFILVATPGVRDPGSGIIGTNAPFRVQFHHNNFTDERKLSLRCKVNCLNPGQCPSGAGSKVTLASDDWNLVLVEWAHNTPGLQDGICRIQIIDGPMAGQDSGNPAGVINRQYSINSVKMGYTGGVFLQPTSSGQHCYDDFQSFRTLAP